MTTHVCFLLASPVRWIVVFAEAMRESLAETTTRDVGAIQWDWFHRLVRRPTLGPICDQLVRPKSALRNTLFWAGFVLLMANAVVVGMSVMIVCMTVGMHLGPATVGSVSLAVALEVICLLPWMGAMYLLTEFEAGISRGFWAWALRYSQAQAAEWLQRHPNDRACYRYGWVYSRD